MTVCARRGCVRPCLARGIGGLAAAEEADGNAKREREERAEERAAAGDARREFLRRSWRCALERLELDTRLPGPEIFQGSRLNFTFRSKASAI
jgi:hypothetical protein